MSEEPNPAGLSNPDRATIHSWDFDSARNAFFSSLSLQDRALYVPCGSASELSKFIKQLHSVKIDKIRESKAIQLLDQIHNAFQPYFAVVDLFVSSKPDVAALVWGALRLVLLLASNFVTFFDKLTVLLEELPTAFRQYGEVFELCLSDKGLRRSQVPTILEIIYADVLGILKEAIRVFTKSDGSVKRTAKVIGSLMWKPFHSRFQDRLANLSTHRKNLFAEISIWHATSSVKEMARNAAGRDDFLRFRDFSMAEMEDASRERDLAQEERRLMELERTQTSNNRQQTRDSLLQIQRALRLLESDRMNNKYREIVAWVSAPNFDDALRRARALRQQDTAMWIFEEQKYQQWLLNDLHVPEYPGGFGTNVLWIRGHPGSGKTILSSSAVDNLQRHFSLDHGRPRDVYYYFFEYKSSSNNTACSAYRSILAQILSRHKENGEILDKFSLMHNSRWDSGQHIAGEMTVVDLFRLSLGSNSILVLDGIDECIDCEDFIACLVSLWNTAAPHILLLSRIHVAGLMRRVPTDNQLDLPASKLSEDIHIFSDYELQRLFDERILPAYAQPQKGDMLKRMVSGANGMFLWARLMINLLRSPYIDARERLHNLSQINTPEGLEDMYYRIVNLIKRSGKIGGTLASKVLTRLIYAPAPISSRQLRQTLVVDELLQPTWDPETVKEFEDTIIVACAGLVERTSLLQDTSFLHDEPALRVIHLSVTETLTVNHSISCMQGGIVQLQLVPDPVIGSLDCATTCLKQLLSYTPAQPLARRFGQGIKAEDLYALYCFSDYAAVNWLLHLQSFINAVVTKRLTYGESSTQFRDSLYEFSSSLSFLLRNRGAMSVWIEAFYTARCTHINYPPAEPLENLAAWAKKGVAEDFRLPIHADLISDIEGFSNELRDVHTSLISATHGSFALQSVAGSGGVTIENVRLRRAESNAEHLGKHVTSLVYSAHKDVSRVMLEANDQNIYRHFHDKSYKERAWNHVGPFDLTELCSGWVATFEVWRLHPDPQRLASGQVHIHPREMLIPVRNYLYHRYSTEISVPVAIHSEVNAFTILETLFSVKPSTNRSAPNCLRCQLPRSDSAMRDFSWVVPTGNYLRPAMYSTTFAASTEHLALLEWQDSGDQHITVCQYDHGLDLGVCVLDTLSLRSGVQKVERVLLHPRRDILAFCAFSNTGTDWQNSAFLWAYRKGTPHNFALGRGTIFEAVEFSSCGEYFIVRQKIHKTSDVIRIPQALLDVTECRPAQQSTFPHGIPLPSDSLIATPSNANALASLGSNISNQLWNFDPTSGDLSALAIEASASGIYMTGSSNSGIQTTGLVMLPTWQGASETTQRIILPKFEGDSLKISVDVDTQSLSTHSSYQLSKAGGNVKPTVIYRDPRFVTLGNSTLGATFAAQSLQLPVSWQSPLPQRAKRTISGSGIVEEGPGEVWKRMRLSTGE